MAKKSIIERQENRSVTIKKYNLLRKYIKGKICSSQDFDEKVYYKGELEKLPRNSSFTRYFCLYKTNSILFNKFIILKFNITYFLFKVEVLFKTISPKVDVY